MRIVINGFGRIGRSILRQILTEPGHDDIEVALVNDIAPLETSAYLFKYDSTFGPLPLDVTAEGTGLRVGAQVIPFASSAQLGAFDFKDVDVVMECTGKVDSRAVAERGLVAGARAVLVSGPTQHADVTAVLGANEADLGDARIVSNSSCTTNAIGPLLRALDAKIGIAQAHVSTVHCYTSSQPMVDTPRGDLARSRAGAESIVPTTTSAAHQLAGLLPDLGPRVSIAAVRVPSLSVSAVDAVIQLREPLKGDARAMLRDLAATSGVIGTTEDPCVSRDMRGRAESLIIALPEIQTINDTQLRLFGWYDNEWGFSARMIDMGRKMALRTAVV